MVNVTETNIIFLITPLIEQKKGFEMNKTEDGFSFNIGDEVWIRPSVLYTKEEPKKVVVGKINESTIHFTEPDIEGYIGARMKSVFHKKENAYWSVDALRATGVFTESELVELL